MKKNLEKEENDAGYDIYWRLCVYRIRRFFATLHFLGDQSNQKTNTCALNVILQNEEPPLWAMLATSKNTKENNENREFAAAYSTAQVGNSGWRKFALRKGRNSYCFAYNIPAAKGKQLNGADFIGIVSDMSGKGNEARSLKNYCHWK